MSLHHKLFSFDYIFDATINFQKLEVLITDKNYLQLQFLYFNFQSFHLILITFEHILQIGSLIS